MGYLGTTEGMAAISPEPILAAAALVELAPILVIGPPHLEGPTIAALTRAVVPIALRVLWRISTQLNRRQGRAHLALWAQRAVIALYGLVPIRAGPEDPIPPVAIWVQRGPPHQGGPCPTLPTRRRLRSPPRPFLPALGLLPRVPIQDIAYFLPHRCQRGALAHDDPPAYSGMKVIVG